MFDYSEVYRYFRSRFQLDTDCGGIKAASPFLKRDAVLMTYLKVLFHEASTFAKTLHDGLVP